MRYVRVLVTTIFCVMLFFSGNFLWAKGNEIDSVLEPIGAALFMILFLLPFTFPGIAILSLALYVMDRNGLRRVWHYALVWAVAGVCLAFYLPVPVAVLLPSLLPVWALIGVTYWALTGRVAGQPGYMLGDFFDRPLTAQVAIWVGVMGGAIAVVWVIMESLKTIGPM